MSSTQEKLPPEHNCHWRAYGQPDGTVVCDECNCAADVNKLQNILLKMANDVLDLDTSGKTLGEPIDEAERAILDLLDKSLDSLEQIDWVPGDDGDFKVREDTEWNAAIETVRQELIDSAKREELELYVKYIENTDKFYPLYASLDRETAIDECRKFASNYGKHRIAQLEQSED